MGLAIFDLDNTLIAGDSDYLWGEYLGEIGVVDPDAHRIENDRFYQEYLEGSMDIFAFLRFQLAPLAANPMERLLGWREEFLEKKIRPILLETADRLIQHHRSNGDELLIITATNSFITAPIAEMLGIAHLIATEPEMDGGRYTGAVAGTPSFAAGKVTRLHAWLEAQGMDLSDSSFYSDSRNDLPLLNLVTRPVAVDPDPKLREAAEINGWKIISLREGRND